MRWRSAPSASILIDALTAKGAPGMTEDEHAIAAYGKIAEQIIKEDARVHERMTWGVSVNGALLALLGAGAALAKDVLPHASLPITLFGWVLVALLAMIALLVCHSSIKGVQDARRQIHYIRAVYDSRWKATVEDRLGLPRPFGTRDNTPIDRWWGDNFFRFIAAVWFLIVVACAVAAAYHLLGLPPPGTDCGAIAS